MSIYLTLSLWVLALSAFKPGTIFNTKIVARTLLTMLCALFVYKLSTLTHMEGSDMSIYIRDFYELRGMEFMKAQLYSNREPLFLSFQWLISQLTGSAAIFVAIISLTYFLLNSVSLGKILLPWQTLIVVFTMMNFTTFYSYITTTIRQGLSISFIVLSIAFMLTNGSKVKFIISCVISALFHWSALPIVAILAAYRIIGYKVRTCLFIWVSCAVLFLLDLQRNIVGFLGNYIVKFEHYTSVAALESYSFKVNRLDFFVFSLVFVVYGLIFSKIINNDIYKKILSVYILFNAYFLLFGFIGYSDRIAAYSWFLIPLLVWYPIFQVQRNRSILVFSGMLIVIVVGFVTKTYQYLI